MGAKIAESCDFGALTEPDYSKLINSFINKISGQVFKAELV